MKKNILNYWLIVCFISSNFLYAHNVGLLVVATGKYICFVEPLLQSADKFFCPDHEVTYFIFTDKELTYHGNRKVVTYYQEHMQWPYATLMRCTVYYKHNEVLKDMDYLFACDADMLFVDTVGDEILADRVATQHPGYVGRRGTYETRSISTAYIAPYEGAYYFAGGFYGGSSDEFLRMSDTMERHIQQDLSKSIIAVWHDESHLNRYFVNNPPTLILSPSYCYPESWHLPFTKRLLALDKNHHAMRFEH